MYTDLTYVNLSYDPHCPRIIVLQKNMECAGAESAVAWKVIRNCRYEWRHPFRFHWQLSVEVMDIDGNTTTRVPIDYGHTLYFERTRSGRGKIVSEPEGDPTMLAIINRASNEPITVNLYRSDRLLAMQSSLLPGAEATFRFNQTLFCGTGLRTREGQLLHSRKLTEIKDEIDLFGLRKARLIMTGGGPGPTSRPLQFHLDRLQTW